jgi:hypothetical protein
MAGPQIAAPAQQPPIQLSKLMLRNITMLTREETPPSGVMPYRPPDGHKGSTLHDLPWWNGLVSEASPRRPPLVGAGVSGGAAQVGVGDDG